MIEKNQLLLRKLGHFGSATMYYAGEWYWGIDRLHYLYDRLDAYRARSHNKDKHKDGDGDRMKELVARSQMMQLNLPATVPDGAKVLPSLEMYYSFRSEGRR